MQTFSPECEKKPYLIPLFWQRHDSHEAIETEMRKMKSVGIHTFVMEPRPHPDYLGQGWWDDVDFVLKKAEELDMFLYFFDDGTYPSGTANGELARRYPEYTKRYWAQQHMDATGPLPHAHFLIDDWLGENESVLRILAAKRTDRDQMLDADSLVDVTGYYRHGRLYWPVPEGEWRVFLIKKTAQGEEEHTRLYCNPLVKEAVGKYLEIVHESHYARYADQFGKRILGFFTDEPRFGNTTGYDRIIGLSNMPLPCSDELLTLLSDSPLGDFAKYLPLLWYPDQQEICRDVRYLYMDTVSRLFAENFTGQAGDWCRAHGVELIGHVVEENGAHSRLGYGAGHYFRAMKGLDAAGIDVVCNLLPEQTSGYFSTLFNDFDCDFNHWGLAKMASSSAHADPKKKNRALCEAFGAYGWSEGLKVMKWITDHLAVCGVGLITPHAFSPSPFPDEDCPPHFYARGNNPQFRYFGIWADYANRLGDALNAAEHHAPVAVLYHAEGEWGSYTAEADKAEPFEKAVRTLAEHQIDCDVVCIDDLLEASVKNGRLLLNREQFRALIVPFTPCINGAFSAKLHQFAANGLPVIFTRAFPTHGYFGAKTDMSAFGCCPTDQLADTLAAEGIPELQCDTYEPDLLVTHYDKDGFDWYFLVNQSTKNAVDTNLTVQDTRNSVFYDAMNNQYYHCRKTVAGERSVIDLHLDPWETVFLVFGDDCTDAPERAKPDVCDGAALLHGWEISIADAKAYPAFAKTDFHELVDLSLPEYLPDFAGTVRYETAFILPPDTDLAYPVFVNISEAAEVVEISVNDVPAGVKLTPPYRFEIPRDLIQIGENRLTVDVTNTVVKEGHRNIFDPYFAQDPTGITGEVTILFKKC